MVFAIQSWDDIDTLGSAYFLKVKVVILLLVYDLK